MSYKLKGKQSFVFENEVFVLGSGSVVGKKEGEGPYGDIFDEVCCDPMIGGKTWEEGESNLIAKACGHAADDAGVGKEDIKILVGGDLLGQIMATTFGVAKMQIPLLGIYGACSTMGESLAVAGMLIEGGYADMAMSVTSSHFAGAEKQFRFPLGYGAQRPKAATWTVTGSGAVVLCSAESYEQHAVKQGRDVCIKGFTTGKIVDYGIMDSMNMGAAMMPAAMDTLVNHFNDLNRTPDYYDLIVTGDLGKAGSAMLKDFMREQGYDISGRHMDCGESIYDANAQDTHSGGSGCGCSAVMLCSYFIREMKKGSFNRILFMPTGALLSPVSFHEGRSVPGIAHAVVIEAKNR